MAGLQRSTTSFRRQGSSGLVWDDRFLSGELNKVNNQQQQGQEEEEQEQKQLQQHHHKKKGENTSGGTVQRSRSNGGGRGYRTGRVSPAIEPPSPKLSACGFCGAFGKKTGGKGQRSRPGNNHQHRSR